MTQHVAAGRRHCRWREGGGVFGVDNAKRGLEVAVGDARFCVHRLQIEDGSASGLAAGAGGGRDRDQRLERPRNGQSLADGSVDVVEKVSRIGRIEIGGLGRVNRGAAAHRHESVHLLAHRKRNRLFERGVRRLDLHAIEEHVGHAGLFKRSEYRCYRRQFPQHWIGHHHHAFRSAVHQVHTYLAGDSPAETNAGSCHLKGYILFHRPNPSCNRPDSVLLRKECLPPR